MRDYWKIIGYTILLILIGGGIKGYTQEIVSDFYWAYILFLCVLTTGSHFLLTKAKSKTPEKFVNVFLISTITRFMIAGFTVVCLVVLLKDRSKPEILNFIAVYFCFLWFEIILLSANLRAISNRELKDADESSI